MKRLDRDAVFFERFRPEQLEELIEYFRAEADAIQGEVIVHVRGEEFTKASMKAGELDFCRVFSKRCERALSARRVD